MNSTNRRCQGDHGHCNTHDAVTVRSVRYNFLEASSADELAACLVLCVCFLFPTPQTKKYALALLIYPSHGLRDLRHQSSISRSIAATL